MKKKLKNEKGCKNQRKRLKKERRQKNPGEKLKIRMDKSKVETIKKPKKGKITKMLCH